MLSLAEQLKNEQSLLVFGRGYNYATALEAALKVRPDIPACIKHPRHCYILGTGSPLSILLGKVS